MNGSKCYGDDLIVDCCGKRKLCLGDLVEG